MTRKLKKTPKTNTKRKTSYAFCICVRCFFFVFVFGVFLCTVSVRNLQFIYKVSHYSIFCMGEKGFCLANYFDFKYSSTPKQNVWGKPNKYLRGFLAKIALTSVTQSVCCRLAVASCNVCFAVAWCNLCVVVDVKRFVGI